MVDAVTDTAPTEHGLGPHAEVLGDDEFLPVAVLVGGNVYVQQGDSLIVTSRGVAEKLSAVLHPDGQPIGAARAVLDRLELMGQAWGDEHTTASQLGEARDACQAAHGAYLTEEPLAHVRAAAIDAAARLIDAIHEIDRCIAAGEQ